MLLITAFLKSLFLPPVNLIAISVVGFAISGRWEILGRRAALAAAIGVFALSTPLMGNALLRLVQEENSADNTGQAIVILAAGILPDTPEYRGPTADALTLERRHASSILAPSTNLLNDSRHGRSAHSGRA